jgi:hypothetical protein
MREPDPQPSHLQGIWLAMSGGGTRAALFHYGVLKRLFELNLLENVEVVSATSGGSLVAALLGVHGPMINGDTERWERFEQDLLDAAANGVIGPTIWSGVAWISLLFAAVFGSLNLLLLLGTGTSSAPLTLFWVCLIVFALAILATAGQMHFLARKLGALPNVEGKRSLTPDFIPEAMTGSGGGTADRFSQWVSNFFLMLDPSYVLWHTLNFRVFRNSVLDDFRLGPKDLDDIQRLFNVSAWAISLRTHPDDGCALKDPEIARLAAQVRTHFDGFSKVECAVLAYLGYYWANRWAENDFADRKQELPKTRMRGIADILPTRFAPPAAMLPESNIVAHLRYSDIQIRSWRWLRRYIARA